MKKSIQIGLTLLFLVSCGNYEEFKETYPGGTDSLLPGDDLSFQTIKDQILTPRCVSCHSNYGTYENVKSNINAIVGMVRANVMPKDGPLGDNEKSLLFAWVNAGMPLNSGSTDPSPNPGPTPLPPEDRLTFSNLSQKVFSPHCIKCHGNFSDYDTVKTQINAIVNMVRTNAMPVGDTLPVDLKSLLFDWAAAGAPQDQTGPLPIPSPEPLAPTYKSLNKNVFQKKCIACHNPAGRASFLDLSSYEALSQARSRLFDFRRPERSEIIDEITDSEEPMPPLRSSFAQVTNEEIKTLIKWIQQGIPNN